jgi:hypothetical protein
MLVANVCNVRNQEYGRSSPAYAMVHKTAILKIPNTKKELVEWLK